MSKSDEENSKGHVTRTVSDTVTSKGFDAVFDLVGGSNIYQWILFAAVSLQGSVLVHHHLGFVFLGAVPEHWCRVGEMLTNPSSLSSSFSWTADQIKNISIPRKTETENGGVVKWESCKMYDLDYEALVEQYGNDFDGAYESVGDFNLKDTKGCTAWNYDRSIYESTVVTEFDLVCDRRHLVASIQASYMGGVIVGSLVFGSLSDKLLGRRKAILAACFLIMVSAFATAFSTSFIAFSAFRFLIAVGVSGSYQNCFVLLLEYSDKKYRSLLGIIQQMPFAVGYMSIPLYAYYIRRWDNLQLAFSITTFILVAYIWILPESARWFASRERDDEAVERLHVVAKWNKKPLPDKEALLPILKTCREDVDFGGDQGFWRNAWQSLSETLDNYLNLVRTPELRKRSLVIWTLWILVNLIYYGVVFDSARLTSDPFLMVFLGGLTEVPAYLLTIPFVSKWGRRPTLVMLFVLTAVAFLAFCATPTDVQTLRILFSMSGKLFVSSAFAVIYLVGAELYPTSARITGLGSAVLMGRLGSIMAPYVVDRLQFIYSDLPTLIFGVTSALAVIVAAMVPETRDSEMTDLVAEVEEAAQPITIDLPFIIHRRGSKLATDVVPPNQMHLPHEQSDK